MTSILPSESTDSQDLHLPENLIDPRNHERVDCDSLDGLSTIQWTPAGILLIGFAALTGPSSIIVPGAAPLAFAVSIAAALAIIARVRVPRDAFNGIELKAHLPKVAHEGRPLQIDVHIHLKHERRSLFDIVLEGRHNNDNWRTYGYASLITPGMNLDIHSVAQHHERGLIHSLEFKLSTTHALGLIRCQRIFSIPGSLKVYPRVDRLSSGSISSLGLRKNQNLSHSRLPGNEDIRGFHAWRVGESPRNIHWKLSAKRRTWIVREFEGAPADAIEIVFLTHIEGVVPKRHRGFESAVRLLASLSIALERQGCSVTVRILSDECSDAIAGDPRRLLPVLSTLKPQTATRERAIRSIFTLVQSRPIQETYWIVTSGFGGAIRSALESECGVVTPEFFSIHRQKNHRIGGVLVELDSESSRNYLTTVWGWSPPP